MRNRSIPASAASLTKRPHDVVRVVRVADRVRAAEEHLEEDVRDLLAQQRQPLPGVLLEEPHRDVEGRAAPHLDARTARGRLARYASARPRSMSWVRTRVASSDWCASRNVVSVSRSRFCSRTQRAELLGAQLLQPLPRAVRPRRPRHGGPAVRTRRAARARRGTARAASLGSTSGKPLTVTSPMNVRAWWRGPGARRTGTASGVSSMNRRRAASPARKSGCVDDVQQERDVRLHAADAELLERPLHPVAASTNRGRMAESFTSSES